MTNPAPLHVLPRLSAIATCVLIALLAVLVAVAPAFAQPGPEEGAPTSAQPAPQEGGGFSISCPLGICDAAGWLQNQVGEIVAGFLGGLIRGIDGAISGFRNDVDFVLRTPEALTYGNDLVQQFAGASRALANGLLAVVTTVGGFNVMFRPYLGSSYASALELLPRLLLGAVLVNTAHWWAKLAIDVNNALCAVFGAGPPPTFADMLGRSMVPTELLIGLIYVVMGLLLVLQQLMRLALVDVLLILAPLAAVCWILPQTHGWGRLWGTLFVGTVFAQAVQVLALRLGFNLATSMPDGTAAGLIQPLLGIAVLAVALKIPGLMRGGGGGGTLVGSLVGTAAGAVVGSGASRLAAGALGGGRAMGGAAGAAGAARPAAASQYSLPLSVGVSAGHGAQQLSLPLATAQPALREG